MQRINTPTGYYKQNRRKISLLDHTQLANLTSHARQITRQKMQPPPLITPYALDREDATDDVIEHDPDLDLFLPRGHRMAFVDISLISSTAANQSSSFSSPSVARTRMITVRESDGKLRRPSQSERRRLNHIYFPLESRAPVLPAVFTNTNNLARSLDSHMHRLLLDKLCVQLEPDDPRFQSLMFAIFDDLVNRAAPNTDANIAQQRQEKDDKTASLPSSPLFGEFFRADLFESVVSSRHFHNLLLYLITTRRCGLILHYIMAQPDFSAKLVHFMQAYRLIHADSRFAQSEWSEKCVAPSPNTRETSDDAESMKQQQDDHVRNVVQSLRFFVSHEPVFSQVEKQSLLEICNCLLV